MSREIRVWLLALVAVVGLLGCKDRGDDPRVEGALGGAKADVARVGARKLVDAYAQWSVAHPDQACPSSIDELAKLAGGDAADPWGKPYTFYCGGELPPGCQRFCVSSPGPDGKPGTADDVKSW